MMISRSNELTRRALFRRMAGLAAMGVGAPLALNLAGFGEAAAFNATDYKALVCVFLQGGNDHANTVVPYDASNYALYSTIRDSLAYNRSDLSATVLSSGQTLTDNLQYALAPELDGMAGLFGLGKLGVLLNVGTLSAPTTLSQYQSSNRAANPLPPKLFSHNDQMSVWETFVSDGATTGWGGKMGDLALSGNGNSMLTCISAAGNAVMMSGANALQYQISPSGAVPVFGLQNKIFNANSVGSALQTLISQTSGNVFEDEYARVTRRSISLQGVVSQALAPVSLTTTFGSDTLAAQLKVVAQLIGARQALGMTRQVFFVSLGGFDTHDSLAVDHPILMGKLDTAMSAFYAATVELGVADKVTTFTASDFGRTLTSNGDGSDHGWGGHHFVMGGAVQGGQFYGTAPHVSITSDDQVGQGRLLPSTAVDQMASTLGRWFGVADSEMATVVPNIGRFATANIGFMG